MNSSRVTNSQAAEGRILAQSILHVASKPDMKALRRIGNLLFLVAWVPTEFKGSQAIACAVNVRARRPRRKRGNQPASCAVRKCSRDCAAISRGRRSASSPPKQSFDWPMGLLIQSSKLSKFWPASHCEATGVQSRASTPMKRPRRVVSSLLALFLQPPWLQIGRREPWI